MTLEQLLRQIRDIEAQLPTLAIPLVNNKRTIRIGLELREDKKGQPFVEVITGLKYRGATIRKDAIHLTKIVNNVTGYNPVIESSQRNIVLSRIFLCHALSLKGYCNMEIAETLGWDHALMTYYAKRMRQIFSQPEDSRELQLWYKVAEAIDNDKKEGKWNTKNS